MKFDYFTIMANVFSHGMSQPSQRSLLHFNASLIDFILRISS